MRFAKLSNTHFIQVVGKDANKFINGLMTSKFSNPIISKNNCSNVLINDNSFYINKNLFFDNTENSGYEKLGLYTLFLNSKGRLLSDAWIYPLSSNDQYQNSKNNERSIFLSKKDEKHSNYLIEVHSSVLDEMTKLFKAHRIVSKVNLKQIDSSYINNWYIYPDNETEIKNFSETLHFIKKNWLKNNLLLDTPTSANEKFLEFLKSKSLFKSDDLEFLQSNIFGIGIDERFPEPALKLVTSKFIDNNPFEIFNKSRKPSFLDTDSHHSIVTEKELEFRRCINDIPEIQDLEPNKYIPIELNYNLMAIENDGIDESYEEYLNKLDDVDEDQLSSIEKVSYSCNNSPIISFNKGCYQGQELTHRSFFTGEIRKRYLPLKVRISSDNSSTDAITEKITSELLKDLKDYNIYFDDFNRDTQESEEQVNAASNPFGSSPVFLKKKDKAGKVVHVSTNGFATGIVNLSEFTKPNRLFYLKANKATINEEVKKQLLNGFSKVIDNNEKFIKLYVEGYVPSWFPEGWNE